MWTVQRWVGTSPQSAASACSSPLPPSTIRNSGFAQPARDEIVQHGAPRLALQTQLVAIRTYNVMIGERRRVAAALIAVP